MQIEIDAVRADLVEERYEVLQRAAQPVNRPGHEHIEFASGGVFEQAVELGAPVTAFGAAHTIVDILVDDFPALARSDLAKSLDLILWGLAVAGRHAGVEGGVSRRCGSQGSGPSGCFFQRPVDQAVPSNETVGASAWDAPEPGI